MEEVTRSGQYLGAVTLVARNGRNVDRRAYGFSDVARTSPMDVDAIFRIYSMTKTVVAVAVLILEEEGKLALDDPIGKYLPQFSGRSATIRHLLTHTTGFAQASEAVEQSTDLKSYAEAASRMAQRAAPGTRFEYNSVNTELASRLVEIVSGMSLDEFLRQRIFMPLGMVDTGFSVSATKRSRIADMTSTDSEGRIIVWPAGDSPLPGSMMRSWFSGAGGLYSTATDFARFSQALLDGGQLDGARILSRRSVERMMTNQLGHLDPPVSQYGEGHGLGGYVNLDAPGRERPGSPGAFGWSGAASTYYMVDRRQRLVAILMMQHIPQGLARDPPKISFQFYNLVYQALSP